ncbi:MAG TPA: DUF4142 domain-containing protein, partial [Actinotalea sp.]|nr:DUF4142 domain-containing protein [Actinotalea sp.]
MPLPDTPGADLQAGLARVVARSGPGLDAAWLALEVSAHRRALQAADTEQAAGSHAQVRDLARTNGARLRGHLDEIVRVAADLGVSLAAEGVDPGRPVPGDPAAAGRAPLEPGEAIRR